MPLDYEKVKEFFWSKLGSDMEGKGRMESAFYHTAQWIYHQGINEGRSQCKEMIVEYIDGILGEQKEKENELHL